VIHSVGLLSLPKDNSWFYNAPVMNKSGADILAFGELAEPEVAPELVNLIFDIGI